MINQKNKYVTCGQMKLLERRADENGLSYYQMMENAGSGAAAVIGEKMSESGRDRDVRYTGFISGYPDSDLPAVAETAGTFRGDRAHVCTDFLWQRQQRRGRFRDSQTAV